MVRVEGIFTGTWFGWCIYTGMWFGIYEHLDVEHFQEGRAVVHEEPQREVLCELRHAVAPHGEDAEKDEDDHLFSDGVCV